MAPVVNIEDLRRVAWRRLPRAVFDFVDGGARDEQSVRRNRAAFEALAFRPRVLVDASECDLSTTVLGEPLALPFLIGPTGLAGLCWPRGEVEAARAAHALGTVYALATHSTCSIEDVARAAPGPLWFQLYPARDRDLTARLVDRAAAAGYRALVLTADVQVASIRERDVRNGFTVPPRVTAANAIDTLTRIGWLTRVLLGPPLTLANLVEGTGEGRSDFLALAEMVRQQIDSSFAWPDLAWLRARWTGPLVLKGVLAAADARRAVEHGVDAVVVSNHGGRQLDGAVSPVEVLPEIVEAVDGRAEVLFDSGVRRGTDIAKALALGARAVLIGRAHLYGLAADGGDGVRRALAILRDELTEALCLLGVPRARALDGSVIAR